MFWGFALIVFGVILLLDNMGYADITDIIENFWPLILIFFGISILMKRKQSQSVVADAPLQQTTPQQGFQSELIHDSNMFGDVIASISSHNFKGGSASTLFGDVRLDLSKCVIADGSHHLRVNGVFGSSTIILPKNTAYIISGSSFFGNLTVLGQQKQGISTKLQTASPSYNEATNRLIISVSQIFGDARVEETQAL